MQPKKTLPGLGDGVFRWIANLAQADFAAFYCKSVDVVSAAIQQSAIGVAVSALVSSGAKTPDRQVWTWPEPHQILR